MIKIVAIEVTQKNKSLAVNRKKKNQLASGLKKMMTMRVEVKKWTASQ
jgi:hypothetical protein